ncbi:M23 family metallopeptidase [Nakamurella sp.]|uniref:M23 family metallopeptidase n=1 Tax=Nakamurella sp. TaxID=1869182 RepID=UPI00378387A8
MNCPRPTRLALVLLVWLLILPGAVGSTGSAHAGSVAGSAGSETGFELPVPPPPAVLVPFAPPADRYGAGHRGVDLAAAPGTVIAAAGSGRVVFAGPLVDRGVVSIVHEGGLRTTYEPVSATVTAGAVVAAGQPIGTLAPGHPPCAPASCLHWGARLPDGTYLDPMALLRPWAVRLWPWDGR